MRATPFSGINENTCLAHKAGGRSLRSKPLPSSPDHPCFFWLASLSRAGREPRFRTPSLDGDLCSDPSVSSGCQGGEATQTLGSRPSRESQRVLGRDVTGGGGKVWGSEGPGDPVSGSSWGETSRRGQSSLCRPLFIFFPSGGGGVLCAMEPSTSEGWEGFGGWEPPKQRLRHPDGVRLDFHPERLGAG